MFRKIKIYILVLVVVFFAVPSSEAKNLTQISDLISTSRPGYQANHTIKFRTTEAIPPSGKIRITPELGFFLIPADFDYTDIDLATSSNRDTGYVERNLFSFPIFTADGISIMGATSTSVIEITLRNNLGIPAGAFVQIKIGDNAVHEEIGDNYIVNPGTPASYHINVETFDSDDNLLDRADPMVAIVEAVRVISYMPKIRSRGSPSGTLTFGTVSTIMSLVTNYNADCRYSVASNTPYALMTDDFGYTGDYFHSETLTGLTGGFHIYFIRCRDVYSVDDTDDYLIYFYVESEEGEAGTGDGDSTTTYDGGDGGVTDGEGDAETDDGGSGGGGGGGSGGGSGSDSGIYDPYDIPPGDPAVEFSGFAYPNSKVYLLVDGVATENTAANSVGVFSFGVDELPRGVYTFGIWAEDREGNKSLTYNTTFYVEEGTKSAVSDIFISPTLNSNTVEINPGDSMSLHGYGAANTFTEIWFYPYLERTLREEEIIKQQVDVDSAGLWNVILNTEEAFSGQYRLKAKSNKELIGYSEFSYIINIGVGEAVEEQTSECANGDLNGDGKVNITDFSIMLYWWNTDNTCADQNDSGNVDLTDFSIMMFYWTG